MSEAGRSSALQVALVGEPQARGFAAARFEHFRAAIASAGHVVTPVDARAPVPAEHADVVVSAGIYGPTEAAVRIAGERPLWVDLPGDPFADAQAVVARGGDPQRVAEDSARVFLPALARADAFSTISVVSRWTLVGQLGLIGRWVGPEELPVHPIPIAWPGAPTPGVGTRVPSDGGGLRILLAGSFNTWFDEDAVADVLIEVMQRTDTVVEVTGGPGQPGGYDRFVARMAGRPVRFHAWVDDPAPVFARCDVLLTLDRADLWEPYAGSRTRVLSARAAGLRVVASAGPELVDELAGAGQVEAVRSRAEAVKALLARGPAPDASWIAHRYDPARVVAPLLDWLRAPRRAPAAPISGVLDHAMRAQRRSEDELSAIRRTWAFKLGRFTPWRRGAG